MLKNVYKPMRHKTNLAHKWRISGAKISYQYHEYDMCENKYDMCENEYDMCENEYDMCEMNMIWGRKAPEGGNKK